ncbi:hypothetical protein E4M02_00350 [Brevundimonas sp. S30B]|uniref:hypothetical protein n=1 Tax=unclassified Brevundimonas TaxID=2622653 RepID=UPI0010724F5E|nr:MULTISPECIES: hypothetical protein [unclassified Brevundimonas]QBX37625.1 hypothetical protein E4M01_07470 [Brevundimonas sp. MF30-B]TFW03582.1 hypothetical protein E4M02_00350 [Brevundimonas sp. S30B]
MVDALQHSPPWAFLARLTALFEWTAVGSILLFVTLLVTIGIASESTKSRRNQERAVLRHIRRMLLSLSVMQRMSIGLFDLKLEPKDFAEHDVWTELTDELDRLELLSLPTETAMQAASDSRSQLKWLAEIYEGGRPASELSIEEASLRSSIDRTAYWISMLDREIEDRDPNNLSRAFRQLQRGAAPEMPPTLLGAAISKAKSQNPVRG